MITAEQFEEAYARIGRKLVGSLKARGLPLAVAQDLAQDAWMNAWQYRAEFREECPLHVWIFIIARRSLRDHFRKRVIEQFPLGLRLACWQDFDTSIEANEILHRCKPVVADLLRKHYLEDSSSVPLTRYARVRLNRARNAARKSNGLTP